MNHTEQNNMLKKLMTSKKFPSVSFLAIKDINKNHLILLDSHLT